VHGRRLTLTLLALAAALSLPSTASAADGDPDLTFSGDGQTFVDLAVAVRRASTPLIAQAPDGSLVVGVATEAFDSRGSVEGIGIYRVGADGEVIEELEFVPATNPELLALRVLSDGRIGFVYLQSGSGARLGRLMADGSPDPTVTEPAMAHKCEPTAYAAAVRSDGGAYLLDTCGVWSFKPSGAVDSGAWGSGSLGHAPFEPETYGGVLGADADSDLFIAPDGKVVVLVDHGLEDVGGARGFGFTSAIVRYTTAGLHDTTFGGDGVALTGNHGYDLTVGPDGRPVVVTDVVSGDSRGVDGFEWTLQRFTAAGQPDNTFGEQSYLGVTGPLCCIRNTRITVQSDHKVLMAANHEDWDRGGPYDRLLLRRYLENGDVDTSFAVAGDQLFQVAASSQGPWEWGPPVLQSDGKILLPVGWQNNTQLPRTISVGGPTGQSVAVTRFNNPSLAPVVITEEQKPVITTTKAAATPSTGSVAASAPPPLVIASRRCTSRRSLQIRLRTGRSKKERSKIVSAVVTVNGKRVNPRRNGATVNLRNLPKGRYSVVIRLRLADGGRVRDVRRYRTCAQKVERELAPLRTHRPR
jgi:uncharacterized delta-60 repeat protein